MSLAVGAEGSSEVCSNRADSRIGHAAASIGGAVLSRRGVGAVAEDSGPAPLRKIEGSRGLHADRRGSDAGCLRSRLCDTRREFWAARVCTLAGIVFARCGILLRVGKECGNVPDWARKADFRR